MTVVKQDTTTFLIAKVYFFNQFKMLDSTILLSLFSDCGCSIEGSTSKACDDKNGLCSCKECYTDEKCDKCKSGYYGYPNCEGRLYL